MVALLSICCQHEIPQNSLSQLAVGNCCQRRGGLISDTHQKPGNILDGI
jgi:hypothetical protein